MTIEALNESELLTEPAWLSMIEDAWPRAPEKLQFSIQEEAEPVMEAAVMEPATWTQPLDTPWKRYCHFFEKIC